MLTIEVKLSQGRQFPGTLALRDAAGALLFGPVPCFGKADNFSAQQHGNPTRDPLRPYGDTPLGTYIARRALPGDNLRSYGPHDRISLWPIEGQALRAAQDGDPAVLDDGHRSGLMIHGGAPASGGGLRPTHGCLRLSNDDIARLLTFFKEPCQCIVTELTKATSSVVPTVSPTGGSASTAPPSSGVVNASSGSTNATPKASATAPTNPAKDA